MASDMSKVDSLVTEVGQNSGSTFAPVMSSGQNPPPPGFLPPMTSGYVPTTTLTLGSFPAMTVTNAQMTMPVDFSAPMTFATTPTFPPQRQEPTPPPNVPPQNVTANHDKTKPFTFSGQNYKRWREQEMFYLTTMNMDRFLHEEPPVVQEFDPWNVAAVQAWRHSDYLARNYVMSYMTDELFDAYETKQTTKDVWDALEYEYKTKDAGTKKFVVFSPLGNCLATASADSTARLWNADGSYLRSFEGHEKWLSRIAFHPSGKYLGTTSYDKTWRLWDVETGEELLVHEGHGRSVYGLFFHVDGSLAASCGLDSLARVLDLRSGRSVLALEGHVKPVHGISFSPNGYHLATGGEDNTCRIWDLRKRKSLYTIPAHSNLISQVKFEPQEGYFVVTASHDMTAKVWSSRDFQHVKTLSDHESIIRSLDVAADGQYIATVSHDKTIKIFSSRNNEKAAMDVDR